MKNSKYFVGNFNSLKYALTATLGLFIGLSMNAQEKSINPLDNADRGLEFTKEQQNELTERQTAYWTIKLTPIKTEEWNNKISKEWNQKLTEKLSAKIEEKLTANIKGKWDPILNEKYPNSSQFYRQ
jgi:hypothetical protein